MFKVDTKITSTVSVTGEEQNQMEELLQQAVETLERELINHSNFNDGTPVCPIMSEYIIAKALEQELGRFSLVPLLERVVCFARMIDKAHPEMKCNGCGVRVQP